MDKLDEVLNTVNEKMAEYPPVVQFSDALGIKPSFLFVMSCGFFLSFLIFGVGGSAIANVIGFLYPCYMSFKSLEADSDVKFWLTYWVVYSAMDMCEGAIDYILFWLPMYYLIKLLFLFWLFLPNFRGAEVIFEYVIAPFFRNNAEAIDQTLEKVGSAAKAVQEKVNNKRE